MSMRQYIGARYVPRFLGTYDNTQIYEALDVVDNGSGTSYIARKTVPAGTPLTNTDYWFLYGSASGAIIALQNDMTQAQNDILGLQGDVDSLKNYSAVDMRERVYLFLSDSYDVKGNFINIVGNAIGCKAFYKRSKNMMGFINTTNNTYYEELVNNNPLTTAQLESITHVVFFPSALNDIYNTTTDIYNAMDTLKTYFSNNMPNLRKVDIMSIGWADVSLTTLQDRADDINLLYSWYAPIAGWGYTDLTRVMRSGGYFDQSDGYHPTTAGGLMIARAAIQAILTGQCSWNLNGGFTLDFDMTLPAAWSGATITHPSNGKIQLKVFVDSNGDINFIPADSLIVIQGITDATTGYKNIDLTPTPSGAFINPLKHGSWYMYDIAKGKFDMAMLGIVGSDMKIQTRTTEALSNDEFRAIVSMQKAWK